VRTVQERFEAKVDRDGAHHVWLGTCDSDGTPQIRVDRRLTTARRVAWELARGPLAPKVTVAACEADPRCVRVEHLRLGRRRRRAPQAPAGPTRRRQPKGTGSIREIDAGVWELAVTAADGTGRRYRRIHGSRDDASAALAAFAVEHGGQAVTLGALIGAYLAHLQTAGRSAQTLRRYQQLWRQWLTPYLGQLQPDALTRVQIERALEHMEAAGQSPSSVHQAAVVLSGALAWAHDHGQVRRNHALGLRLPDGTKLAPPRHR
jgi:hypothetical protein